MSTNKKHSMILFFLKTFIYFCLWFRRLFKAKPNTLILSRLFSFHKKLFFGHVFLFFFLWQNAFLLSRKKVRNTESIFSCQWHAVLFASLSCSKCFMWMTFLFARKLLTTHHQEPRKQLFRTLFLVPSCFLF